MFNPCFIRSYLTFVALAGNVVIEGGEIIDERDFWTVILLAAIVAPIVAYLRPSKILRLLASLMAFQFVGAAMVQPGDGGACGFVQYVAGSWHWTFIFLPVYTCSIRSREDRSRNFLHRRW